LGARIDVAGIGEVAPDTTVVSITAAVHLRPRDHSGEAHLESPLVDGIAVSSRGRLRLRLHRLSMRLLTCVVRSCSALAYLTSDLRWVPQTCHNQQTGSPALQWLYWAQELCCYRKSVA
jgi:hypothetical protein